MLHAGLDLSRRRLDVCVLNEAGEVVRRGSAFPDRDCLAGLARELRGISGRVTAAIESMKRRFAS